MRAAPITAYLLLAAALAPACSPPRDVLTFSGSVVGEEGAIVRGQIARFAALHPGVEVEVRATPDAADARHQLYVQWLNAWSPDPDVLQLDVIWTAEFAAAGWIVPLEVAPAELDDFVPATLAANRWRGRVYALPWFVDVGMLYWRSDLLARAPATFDELAADARAAIDGGHVRAGLLWQGARYEGLVTVFLEHLVGFGGAILDESGDVVVDAPAAVRALAWMRDSIEQGLVPRDVLHWQEEQTRFAFQAGDALFLRNWPYCAALLTRPAESAVAGRFAVAPMPHGAGGRSAAALGGAQLAVNARSRQPELARELVAFLTAPEQMAERARAIGQFPARRSLYAGGTLERSLPIPPADALRIVEQATPRPVTPIYAELSDLLQVHLHRALTRQEDPAEALAAAAASMRAVMRRAGLAEDGS